MQTIKNIDAELLASGVQRRIPHLHGARADT